MTICLYLNQVIRYNMIYYIVCLQYICGHTYLTVVLRYDSSQGETCPLDIRPICTFCTYLQTLCLHVKHCFSLQVIYDNLKDTLF